MTSNVPSRKTSNGVNNNRSAQKQLKLEMPQQLTRMLQQPLVVSINAKDASKDASKEASKDATKELTKDQVNKEKEKKWKSVPSKSSAISKPPTKLRHDGKEQTVRGTPSAPGKVQANGRYLVTVRQHLEPEKSAKRSRSKLKTEGTVNRTKEVRSAATADAVAKHPARDTATTNKSPEKPEAAAVQRTKTQSHNTKIFFDKYLKFAYDLSKPDGVRQLEAHFFPADQGQQQSKSSRKTNNNTNNNNESGDSPTEKQHSTDDKMQSIMQSDDAQQMLQQS